MFLTEFNQTGKQRLAKINKFLKEEFNISTSKAFPKKEKLQKLKETAEMALVRIKGSSKKFHLNPEYAKFLNLKEAAECMLKEGMYANSPAHREMKEMINASVRSLMDSGYNLDEACSECMNRFRMDGRFAHDDEYVLPIVIAAAHKYMDDNNMDDGMGGPDDMGLNELVMGEMSKKYGKRIEEQITNFSKASGKSRNAVVSFLNTLSEDNVTAGLNMFGQKVSKRKVNEDLAVEQAEVVMAVRALSDDIQEQVERIGRMMNEDMPAISDQMRKEMGSQTAQSLSDSIAQILGSHLESAKATKSALDQTVSQMSGEETDINMDPELGAPGDDLSGLGGVDDMGGDLPMDTNEPAAAGPEDEPLGRAAVDI